MERYTLPLKEEIINIVESSKNLEKDFKIDLLNTIKNEFKGSLNLKRFTLEYLEIKPNTRTPYIGLNIDKISQDKAITLIKGTTGSGKTTSFDKIWHFFCNYKRDISVIKRLKTKLKLILKETNSNIQYSIDYDSKNKFDGKRFKISRIFLDNDGKAINEEEIGDPEEFLKQNLIIDYNLNETMFIPEVSEDSFVSKYCTDENKFRELFRIQILKILFDKILNYKVKIASKNKELSEIQETCQQVINNYSHTIEILNKNYEKNDFLIKNENEYLIAKEVREQIDDELTKIEENQIREISGLKLKLKQNRNELNDLSKYNLDNVDNIDMLLYNLKLRHCWICDTIIPQKIFSTRKNNGKCYICDIGNRDYSLELNTLPSQNIETLIDDKNKLKKEIKELKENINSYYNTKKNIIKKPDNINQKIWDQSIYIDNVKSEISNAKEENKKILVEKEEIYNEKEEIDKKKNEVTQNLTLQSNKIEPLNELEKKFLEYETQQYEKFKNEILLLSNGILMSFTNKMIGKIVFNKEKKLSLVQASCKDYDKKEINERLLPYDEARYILSKGQLRAIDFSIAFSFLFLNQKFLMRPLNILFIDSLSILDNNNTNKIFRDLAKVYTNYKIIIFDNNKPSNIESTEYQYKELKINPLMVTLGTYQENLDKYLHK